MKNRWLLLPALAAVIIISINCNSGARIQKTNAPQEAKLNINETGSAVDKIVFLTFEVTMTDSLQDLYSFTLKKKHLAVGSLKNDRSGDESGNDPNYFYYRISDENVKTLSFQKVQNPLKPVYEYPAEEGSLGKKLIVKKSGEVVVRFNYNRDTKYISFLKADGRTKALKTIYHALL